VCRDEIRASSLPLWSVPWLYGIHIFFVIFGFIMILATRNFGEPDA
jgi:hypothetical protein